MFKIIRGGNLILETPDSRQTSFQYDQGRMGGGGGAVQVLLTSMIQYTRQKETKRAF